MKSLETLEELSTDAKLFKDHGLESSHFGRAETLRFNVLTHAVEENFAKALKDLEDFYNRPSAFPQFQSRVERYVFHARDIVNAIKTKRSFPGINSLTRAKQQELREKYREHFRELHFVLTRIEKVQADMRLNDAKATAWVVRSLWYASVALFLTSIALGMIGGTARSIELLVDDSLNQILGSIFK